MNKKEMIKEEVEKTMELFETIDQIEPDPFFFNKLNMKLKENKKRGFFNNFPLLTGLKLKPVLLIFLIIVNLISIMYILASKKSQLRVKKDLNYYSAIFKSEYLIDQNMYVVNISENIHSGEK